MNSKEKSFRVVNLLRRDREFLIATEISFLAYFRPVRSSFSVRCMNSDFIFLSDRRQSTSSWYTERTNGKIF